MVLHCHGEDSQLRTMPIPTAPIQLRAAATGLVLGLALTVVACGRTDTAQEPSAEPAEPSRELPEGSASKPAASPEEGGPRNWTVRSDGVNLRETASVSSSVLTTFSAGKVLDNLGCRLAEGRTWCDVQPLGGGPRGFVAAELLQPAVAPHGAVEKGSDDSALRAGQGDFDASGSISCASAPGQPLGNCPFGVARAGGGYATVVLTRADGGKRALYFRMGRAIGADTSEADGSGSFSASKEGDLYTVRVGNERYELPEAVVFGG